ncbi:MAG: BAX inhibitor (BI)-1/YccA family protein, partial [Gammaproteobacteria bacterium]
MNHSNVTLAQSQDQIVSTNKVLKNTYMLLSATLAFSAVTAFVSIGMNMPPMTYLVALIASMVLGMFVLPRTANS